MKTAIAIWVILLVVFTGVVTHYGFENKPDHVLPALALALLAFVIFLLYIIVKRSETYEHKEEGAHDYQSKNIY